MVDNTVVAIHKEVIIQKYFLQAYSLTFIEELVIHLDGHTNLLISVGDFAFSGITNTCLQLHPWWQATFECSDLGLIHQGVH